MTILNLSEIDLIGTGTRRYCYAHPEDEKLCIKVLKNKKNSSTQQQREINFYKKIMRGNTPTSCISRYHGALSTNLGMGYVYDAIKDEDGTVSKNFEYYIREEKHHSEEYIRIIGTIEEYLFAHLVIFYDLNSSNIVCKKLKNGSLQPFIIDGLGDVVAIPILNYSKYFLRRKIKRRWFRWIRRMSQNHEWMINYKFNH